MWFIHSHYYTLYMQNKPIPYLVGKWLTYLSFGLFVVLAVLKLFGVVAWSWWLIFAPFALPLAFCVVICLLAMYLVRISKQPYEEE